MVASAFKTVSMEATSTENYRIRTATEVRSNRASKHLTNCDNRGWTSICRSWFCPEGFLEILLVSVLEKRIVRTWCQMKTDLNLEWHLCGPCCPLTCANVWSRLCKNKDGFKWIRPFGYYKKSLRYVVQ